MTRRTLLTLAAGALPGRGEVRYRVYARCLPDYITRLAKEAHATRNLAIAKLTTRAEIQARQGWVQETFWPLVGGMPERTALNTRTLGAFDRPNYRVEKLVYESRPGFHVPANLYIPKNHKPPYPGILFQMGHSLNGKASELYQKCCQGLTQLGYLVLAFEPMGQGERTYYPTPNGVNTRLNSATAEHTTPGKQMLLVGDTATRMQTWDAVRSLDVLASHPLVDPKRLASTGQSGGGTLTMLLAAVDERLAAVAIACGNTENFACENFNAPGSVDDAEQDLINAAPIGFDRWDLLYPMAPKPMLIALSARDFFGTYSPNYLADGRAEFERLKRVYRVLGAEGRLEWYETPVPHALSHDLRVQIYNFFEKTLKNSDRKVSEPPVKPETDETLYVGPTGNTVRDFKSKTPLTLTRERAAAIRRSGSPDLAELLDIRRPAANLSVTALGRAHGEVGPIDGVEVEVSPEVWLPGYLFLPAGAPKSVIICIEPRGRALRWKEGDLYPQLAAAGHVVAAFDIRGIGDLAPEIGRGNPNHTRSRAEENAYAWASMMLGKSLLGQRVSDLLAIAQAIRNHPPTRNLKIALAALGHLTTPALFAASIDSKIDVVYTSGGLTSYASLLETEEYTEPFANFLPNILSRVDLPEIRNGLGARLKQGRAWDLATLAVL